MLTFTSKKSDSCLKLMGIETNQNKQTHLIAKSTSLLMPSESSSSGLDTCSFYAGGSDEAVLAYAESTETIGSLASATGGGFFGGVFSSCVSGGSSGGSVSCSGGGGGCSFA